MHLKLDEVIRALKGARNKLVDLEDLSDEEVLAEIQSRITGTGEQSKSVKQAELETLMTAKPELGNDAKVWRYGASSRREIANLKAMLEERQKK